MQALPSGFPNDLIGAFDILKTRSRLAVDDLKVLAMIESAGEILYQNMAKTVSSEEAKNRPAQAPPGSRAIEPTSSATALSE